MPCLEYIVDLFHFIRSFLFQLEFLIANMNSIQNLQKKFVRKIKISCIFPLVLRSVVLPTFRNCTSWSKTPGSRDCGWATANAGSEDGCSSSWPIRARLQGWVQQFVINHELGHRADGRAPRRSLRMPGPLRQMSQTLTKELERIFSRYLA